MSPFKSQAQRAKFYEMYKQGQISKETLDAWEKETPHDHKLPKRMHEKKKPKSKDGSTN